MKFLVFTIAVAFGFVSVANQALGNPSAQNYGQVDEWEYRVIKDNCRRIICMIESRLASIGHGGGALNGSAAQHAFKPEISNYLFSIGTPAAKKIYQEYEAIKWKYPDIKKI